MVEQANDATDEREREKKLKDFNLKSAIEARNRKGRRNKGQNHEMVEGKMFGRFVYDFVKV